MKTLYEQLTTEQKEILNSNNGDMAKKLIKELKKNYYMTALSLALASELHNIFYGTIILIDLLGYFS